MELFDGSWVRTGFGILGLILLVLGVIIDFRDKRRPYRNGVDSAAAADGVTTCIIGTVMWLVALFWPQITSFFGSL